MRASPSEVRRSRQQRLRCLAVFQSSCPKGKHEMMSWGLPQTPLLQSSLVTQRLKLTCISIMMALSEPMHFYEDFDFSYNNKQQSWDNWLWSNGNWFRILTRIIFTENFVHFLKLNFIDFSGDYKLPSSSGSTSALGSATGHSRMHLVDPSHLISYDNSMMLTSSSSPISSPGLMSPPSTANTQIADETAGIFQFPGQGIKQEDWNCTVDCLQETPTSQFPPSTVGPLMLNSSQGSPMAVSPTMSTLNTPRGSITSMRSQQSPMNTDSNQVQPQATPLADPMMSSYDAFDSTAFVSYTTVSHQNFPSPPGSPTAGIVSSTTTPNFAPAQQPIQSYEDFYMPASSAGHMFPNQSSVMTNYGSTPDPSESFVSSDTCPETPDSSVKEEGDVNSPDTGSYICLWQDCHEEFAVQKMLVEHISENHMNSQKGCEEFPCLWKVQK